MVKNFWSQNLGFGVSQKYGELCAQTYGDITIYSVVEYSYYFASMYDIPGTHDNAYYVCIKCAFTCLNVYCVCYVSEIDSSRVRQVTNCNYLCL